MEVDAVARVDQGEHLMPRIDDLLELGAERGERDPGVEAIVQAARLAGEDVAAPVGGRHAVAAIGEQEPRIPGLR